MLTKWYLGTINDDIAINILSLQEFEGMEDK